MFMSPNPRTMTLINDNANIRNLSFKRFSTTLSPNPQRNQNQKTVSSKRSSVESMKGSAKTSHMKRRKGFNAKQSLLGYAGQLAIKLSNDEAIKNNKKSPISSNTSVIGSMESELDSSMSSFSRSSEERERKEAKRKARKERQKLEELKKQKKLRL